MVPEFLADCLGHLPYHQIAELTIWMDKQKDVRQSIEQIISESLPTVEEEIPETNPACLGKGNNNVVDCTCKTIYRRLRRAKDGSSGIERVD